jgi:pyruvate/2-oxoglutarate/acetoin dehydrogenase E1 component
VEFRRAIRDALDEELARDDRVVFFGEDVAAPGGVFAVTPGLQETHGSERVFDTPISELALMGSAFGSAICGLRPVIEIMFGDFLTLAMDGLVNQAAKYWYLSNEQASVPLVVRSAVGAGGRFGAIHSQNPASWFTNVPGLKIVAPATPGDAKALLKSAIRDDNPVLFLEHKRLYSLEQEAPEELVAIGTAAIRRQGSDVTIVSAMKGVHDCLAAAELLAKSGIDAEVIDLRTLRPLDEEMVLASLARTNRLVIVEEGPLTGGWAGEVLAIATERARRHPTRRSPTAHRWKTRSCPAPSRSPHRSAAVWARQRWRHPRSDPVRRPPQAPSGWAVTTALIYPVRPSNTGSERRPSGSADPAPGGLHAGSVIENLTPWIRISPALLGAVNRLGPAFQVNAPLGESRVVQEGRIAMLAIEVVVVHGDHVGRVEVDAQPIQARDHAAGDGSGGYS